MDSLQALPQRLLPWFSANARSLPWRQDREPYHVWLSEIMLQQTRVEAVKPYYARFLEALPDVAALAAAPEEQLLKLWEGLGYYSRARNLQKAARIIAETGFPDSYEGWLALPGVGAYTAGAVASISLGLPVAAVDGNVLRVLARFTNDSSPVDDPACKKRCKDALEQVYPPGACGAFTQALMELGATVCTPSGPPRCSQCPLLGLCAAEQAGTACALPVRAPKKAKKVEELTVFLLRCGDRLALEKRPARGLLAGLWQLPNTPGFLTPQQAMNAAGQLGVQPAELQYTVRRQHIFTHIRWEMQGVAIRCLREAPGLTWVSPAQLAQEYALPTAFRQFIEEDSYERAD